MAENNSDKNNKYVALFDISGKSANISWTIRQGKPVSEQLLSMFGGAEKSVKSGIVCLVSDYDKKISDAKKADESAIKKGEASRSEMIKTRQEKAKAEQLKKAKS